MKQPADVENNDTDSCTDLFRAVAAAEPADGSAQCYQRDVLSWRAAFAVAHGGLRHGGCQHFGRHVCQCAGHGAPQWHDLSAALHGLHPGLCGCGLRAAARLLQAGPHQHICLPRPAAGPAQLPEWCVVLPAVEDGRVGREVLRGLHDTTAVRVRRTRCAVRGERRGNGDAHLALHAAGWGAHARLHRRLPDHLPVHVPSPYYLYGDVAAGIVGGQRPADCDGRRAQPCLRLRRLVVASELLETAAQRCLHRHRDDGARPGHDAEEPHLPHAARGTEGHVQLRCGLPACQLPLPRPRCAAGTSG